MARRRLAWTGWARPVAKVAVLLAMQRSSLAAWRRATMVLCGFVLVLAAGSVLSLWSAATTRQQVAHDRRPVPAAEGMPATRILEYGPVVDDRQFPLLWVEPLAEGAPVPPGLRRLPEVGTVVLSPALYEALGPDVLATFGLRGATDDGRPELIGPSGLTNPDEFIAYARPPANRSIAQAPRAIAVSHFGSDAPMTPVGLGYPPDAPGSILLGGLALLLVPSLYLVWVCAGSGAQLRDARLATLFELGASRGTRRAVVFVEAAIQSVAGVALGALLWWGVLAHRPGFGVAGLPYFRGDLEVPVGQTIGVAVAALLAIGLLAVVQSSTGARSGRARDHRRSRSRGRFATVLRLGALGLVLALVGLAQTRPYPASARYWQLAVVVAVGTQPFTLPLYVALLGRWARGRRAATTWLAGRRMVHSPVRLARPAFALAGLVLVAVVGISVAAVQSAATTSSPTSDPALVPVGWLDPTPGDLAALRRALPNAAVLALVEHEDGSSHLSVPSCADILVVASETTCEGDAIPPSVSQRLLGITRLTGITATATLDPSVESQGGPPVHDAIVLGSAQESGQELYERVLPRANRILGVTNLYGGGFLQLSQDARRAGAGIAFAAAVVLLSSLALLGDRAMLIAREDESLDVLGLAPEAQRRITFLEVALPALASVAAGAAVGALFALTGQDLDTKPETVFLWLPILTGISVVVVLTVAVATFVSRIRPATDLGRRSGARNH